MSPFARRRCRAARRWGLRCSGRRRVRRVAVSLYAVATDGSRLWQVAESGTEDGRQDDPIGADDGVRHRAGWSRGHL